MPTDKLFILACMILICILPSSGAPKMAPPADGTNSQTFTAFFHVNPMVTTSIKQICLLSLEKKLLLLLLRTSSLFSLVAIHLCP
jgi:hypothetical protein